MIFATFTVARYQKINETISNVDNTFNIENCSNEELYKDMFVTLLTPYIKEAITKYYGQSYQIALAKVEILDIERPLGYRSFKFITKIQVKPFVGAHNTIGIDHLTYEISSGEVKLKKFEHIKSFKLPPHYNQ